MKPALFIAADLRLIGSRGLLRGFSGATAGSPEGRGPGVLRIISGQDCRV